ncbi:MAG: S-layer homology domain-containing protein [Clostridia bacterium]|nr:S-layer homology domain-containing protein [Clostridia bacterium]
MKKRILIIVLGVIILVIGSIAYFVINMDEGANVQNENTIKYIKSEEGYDYGSDTVYIARDKETNELIPFAIGPLDGYSYAFIQKNRDFTITKEPYNSPYNDLGEKYKYDSYIGEITSRGLLTGFEDGGFKPDNELTKAEMASAFAKLFNITGTDTKSCFKDVPENHWAKEQIMSLVERGIFKKSKNFNPDSSVTREEVVDMAFCMLSDFGMIDEEKDYDYSMWIDYEEITDYAKESFKILKANGYHIWYDLIDHDFMDTSDDEYYFYPKRSVTRIECCEFLYQFIRIFFNNNAPAIEREDAPQIEIPVLDGSTSTYPITQNIYSSYYHNSKNHPDFPKAHSKTVASYKRLIDGEVEMIFVPDAGEEVLKYAKEKNVKLKFVPIAKEALVFFTGTNNKVNNITTNQLHDIYVDNKITNWNEVGGDDGILAAYCRNEDSGSHAQMEKFILNGKQINENILKERTSIMMSSILTDVDDYNRNNDGNYAMGYSLFYYYLVNSSVLGPLDLKFLSIDGIAPTEETISDGTYPYTTNYYAVIRDGENNQKVDLFLELMQGKYGEMIAGQSGLGVRRYYGEFNVAN